MEWIEDRETIDGRSLARAFGVAVGITVALTLFVVVVMAGVVSWAAAVAGL